MTGLSHHAPSANSMLTDWGLNFEERLARAINRVADREFMVYFQEAWTCFVSRAYNSALVIIQTASSCYIKKFVERVAPDVFEYYHWRHIEKVEKDTDSFSTRENERQKIPPAFSSLSRLNDSELIKICREAGILPFPSESMDEALDWYSRLRERRNALAHGEWTDRSSPEEVTVAAENGMKYLFSFRLDSQRLALDAKIIIELVAYGHEVVEQSRAESLVVAVPESERLTVIERLLDVYRSEEDLTRPRVYSINRIRSFIVAAIRMLSEQDRANCFKRLINLMGECSGVRLTLKNATWDKSKRERFTGITEPCRNSFRRMVELRIWNQDDLPGVYRAGFYEAILHFFDLDWGEHGENIGLPSNVLFQLKRRSPPEFRTRLEELMQRT